MQLLRTWITKIYGHDPFSSFRSMLFEMNIVNDQNVQCLFRKSNPFFLIIQGESALRIDSSVQSMLQCLP